MNTINTAAYKILGFSILLLFASCGNKKEAPTTVEKEATPTTTKQEVKKDDRKVFMFFGNSLTAGYGLDEEFSFPSLIQDTLDALDAPYRVINAGLSGETTSGGLKRIEWVLNQHVDIFVLELGANDMLRGLPLEETEKNLLAILDEVRSTYPEAQLAICEMKAAPNMGEDYVQNFEKIYEKIGDMEDVHFIPFFLEEVAGNSSLVLPDGKHPNAEGQKIVAKNIFKSMQPLLELP